MEKCLDIKLTNDVLFMVLPQLEIIVFFIKTCVNNDSLFVHIHTYECMYVYMFICTYETYACVIKFNRKIFIVMISICDN